MFYVFHGDNEHAIQETLAELRARLGDSDLLDLNTIRFEGGSITLSELQHACDSLPFLTDRRLIIVDDLISQNPPFIDDLLTYLPEMPESTRLVFIESKKLSSTHPMVRFAEDHESGYVKSFMRPEGGQLERWIRQRVEAAGGRIEPHAAHLLAINVGNELALLDNEIEKLVLYRGHEPITAEDVPLLCTYVAAASIFDLVDALGSRHGHTAAQLLNKKLGEGADPFYLFSMVTRQFRLLIQVKELAQNGHSPAEAAEELGIHGYVAGKLYQQSHNYTLSQLESVYRRLLDVDYGVKTGQTDMATALSLLVAGVSV